MCREPFPASECSASALIEQLHESSEPGSYRSGAADLSAIAGFAVVEVTLRVLSARAFHQLHVGSAGENDLIELFEVGTRAAAPDVFRRSVCSKCLVLQRAVSCDHHLTEMYWVSRNSIIPSCDPSRPIPDCFMPPNGAAGSDTMPRLRPIMPKSSRSDSARPRETSRV